MTTTIDNRTPLEAITTPWPGDAREARRAIVANAIACIGLEAGDPETRGTLEVLLGPVAGDKWDLDRPFRIVRGDDGKIRTEGVSTCGLVAEGIWRRVGVDAPWLSAPYGERGRFDSISRALRFARSIGPRSAWIQPGDGLRPEPGDYVVLGVGLTTHALTVIGWLGDVLVSVDGGQRGRRGLQAVHKCQRPWRDTSEGAALGTRPVLGWVRVDLLPYTTHACAPVGWRDVAISP